MGVDINAMIEIKDWYGENYYWQAGSVVPIARNRELFAVLGNIRENHEPPYPYIGEKRLQSLFPPESEEDPSIMLYYNYVKKGDDTEAASHSFLAWLFAWKEDVQGPSYATLKELIEMRQSPELAACARERRERYGEPHGYILETMDRLINIVARHREFYADLYQMEISVEDIRLVFYFDW